MLFSRENMDLWLKGEVSGLDAVLYGLFLETIPTLTLPIGQLSLLYCSFLKPLVSILLGLTLRRGDWVGDFPYLCKPSSALTVLIGYHCFVGGTLEVLHTPKSVVLVSMVI